MEKKEVIVLILVVMEYTQWVEKKEVIEQLLKVLILVVMEYTQWAWSENDNAVATSLNPCCNGIYSMSECKRLCWNLWCLNPCCNGIYSMRLFFVHFINQICVLILVVMEYTQWVSESLSSGIPDINVLILVVMEYTQWENWKFKLRNTVLILVVMEYTQWEQRLTYPLYKAF